MVLSVNPFLPEPVYKSEKAGTKIATPDILISEGTVTSTETMTDYIFDKIGGQEILSSSRSDLIDSPYNDNYTPLLDAGVSFEPEIPIKFSDGFQNTFGVYSISLENHSVDGFFETVDETGNITVRHVNQVESDIDSGTITINVKNLKPDYLVEVEILSSTKKIVDAIL